ncbi:MAG: EamA family transporter RarD [Mariniblastus sp.]
MPNPKNARFGLGCAIGAQLIWGLFPIYIDVLKPHIEAPDIVAHRVVWSFLMLIGLVLFARFFPSKLLPNASEISGALQDRKAALLFASAACLIATNWLVFVWAVSHEMILDASLGYYICPQLVVLLGVVFLRERLSKLQWAAIFLSVCGVAYIMRGQSGVPLIAILIALSFGGYALSKKRTKLTALAGLTCETGILLVPALVFLAWRVSTPEGKIFLGNGWLNLMLIGLGPTTIAPLALYATALKHIKLSTVGLLQFLGPTIQFMVGVFVFGESFDLNRFVGFAFVWVGIGLYLYAMHRNLQDDASETQDVASTLKD